MQNDPLPSSKIFRMKPDLSFFPSLSDEGKFTQFYQGFEAAACGTGLGEVVDFSYRPPPGTNEEVSFRNKAMWLYYILYCKVTTTEGRDIIHRHRNTKNGRMVATMTCVDMSQFHILLVAYTEYLWMPSYYSARLLVDQALRQLHHLVHAYVYPV